MGCGERQTGLDHYIGHFRPLRMIVSVLERPVPSVFPGFCAITEADRVADAMIEAAKLMGDSPENNLTIFIRGGEPWRMGYCWRTP
jgi:hypothetical protein